MKNKYVFGGIIIAIFLVLMGYLFTQSNIEYADDFSKVMTNQKTVKATGSWVKEKSYQIDNSNKTFSFYISDVNGNQMKVIYEGTIPNNFESAKSVVITGKYQNGYFHAKDILTKCPSKYEEQTAKTSGI